MRYEQREYEVPLLATVLIIYLVWSAPCGLHSCLILIRLIKISVKYLHHGRYAWPDDAQLL
jgi:hypothetical protein